MRVSKTDILAINEAKLGNTTQDHEINILCFEVVRKDGQVNGGTRGRNCFYLRSNLNYTAREDLTIDTHGILNGENKKKKPFSI